MIITQSPSALVIPKKEGRLNWESIEVNIGGDSLFLPSSVYGMTDTKTPPRSEALFKALS